MTTPDIYREELDRLQKQLASPPPGWFTFGSHIDQPGIKLEFWGDDAGVPMWERPVQWADEIKAEGFAELALVFRNITYISAEDEAQRLRVAEFIDMYAADQRKGIN